MRKLKTIYNPLTHQFHSIDEGIGQLEHYLSDLGYLRRGLTLKPNKDMSIHITAGFFRGYIKSKDAIETIAFDARPRASFLVLDALTGNPLTEATSIIDPTRIDNAQGKQKSLGGNNRASMIEFYQSLNGQLYMLYGQVDYSNINTAKRDYIFEQKVKPGILDNAIRLGAFLLRKNTNSLQHPMVVPIPVNDRGQF